MTVSDIRLYLNEVLIPLCEVYPSSEFYLNSLDIKERHGFSFYDSMIVEAAISTDCHTLFTEDMQHNMKIKDLVIKNPFKNL
jgi:predicted nucleic acid-binding protein